MAPARQLSQLFGEEAESAANSQADSRASTSTEEPAAKQARWERAGEAKEEEAKEAELGDEVLEVMLMKAALSQVSQQSRALGAVAANLWTTSVVPLSWEAVKAAQTEAKHYSKVKVVEGAGRLARMRRIFVEVAKKAASEEPGSMAVQEEWQVGLRPFTAEVASLVPYFLVKAAKGAPAEEHKAIVMWCFARPASPAMAAAAWAAAGGEQKDKESKNKGQRK